ncbi:MAG: tRNA uridine-5-carboxymethylaminomethyl(34) synthesis GTPase MnmE [Fimbriimonadaceae bacterium]|nr:tRNA uridine-5-carboxymethylaminomethyl(34) synthesis GTPase MnmE [Fimbriimonadaceae bacterium]
MVDRLAQTIVAPITAVGGSVAMVRVSGPMAYSVAKAVFANWPDKVEPRRAVYGTFVHGDDGLALPFASGASYTGDETVEFSVHGSAASVAGLVEACCQAGARPAGPGEFTMRAFLSGRMDLTQAEGVRTLVEAQSDAALRQGRLLREGRLSAMVAAVREAVLGALATVEASTDFSEEVGDLDRDVLDRRLADIVGETDRLLGTAAASRVAHVGVTVAVVGKPNAGKSSLFNALLNADRAIVTDVPGTTRDALHETIQAGGMLMRLVDTAGLRETSDTVESVGVGRSRDAASEADLVLYVYDASAGFDEVDEAEFEVISRPKLAVANKADLPHRDGPGTKVSAVTRSGLDELLSRVVGSVGVAVGEVPFVLPRHVPLLQRAREALVDVRQTLGQPVPDDLAAVGLRAAARALGEITGETATPDVVERIFHDFCIGK